MRSLAGQLLPGNISTQGWQRASLLHCITGSNERERGQAIPGRNEGVCDERGTRSKRVSRTSVRKDEWKHNKDTT